MRKFITVKKGYGKWGRHYLTIKDLETEKELYGDSDGSIQREIEELKCRR